MLFQIAVLEVDTYGLFLISQKTICMMLIIQINYSKKYDVTYGFCINAKEMSFYT